MRRVRADELDRLQELRLRALLDAPAAFGRRHEEEVDRDPSDYAGWVDGGATLVAEDASGWHGLVAVTTDNGDRSLCHLLSMWTDPARRRAGVGRMLVDCAVEEARLMGATRLQLGVVEGNTSAIRLYQRAGFAFLDKNEPLRSDPARTVAFMERDLRPPPDRAGWSTPL